MKLVYNVNEKPSFGKNLVFAFQQLLAIIAATVLVPVLVDPNGAYLSQASALIGAGVGTIVYLLFTRFKSPVFLGSSLPSSLPWLRVCFMATVALFSALSSQAWFT